MVESSWATGPVVAGTGEPDVRTAVLVGRAAPHERDARRARSARSGDDGRLPTAGTTRGWSPGTWWFPFGGWMVVDGWVDGWMNGRCRIGMATTAPARYRRVLRGTTAVSDADGGGGGATPGSADGRGQACRSAGRAIAVAVQPTPYQRPGASSVSSAMVVSNDSVCFTGPPLGPSVSVDTRSHVASRDSKEVSPNVASGVAAGVAADVAEVRDRARRGVRRLRG